LAFGEGGSVWSAQRSLRACRGNTTRNCDIAGGGLCGPNDPPIRYQIKSIGFPTMQEATDAWCAELAGKPTFPSAVAGDSKAEVYGGLYWIGTAPSCP
jgi:hypothetical protein